MAAPGRHVGHYIQRNGRFLLCNIEQVLAHRSFGWTTAVRQQAAEASKESTESIVIPRKKTWSKEAVLEALASTVSRDPTAYPYQFQDDPYLSPRTFAELRLFSLSQESGRSAAKYFVNNNPKLFTQDFAVPHIPCLMPETVSLQLEEVSEEALKERINLRKVTAAVEMYDQLLQAGTAVSMETTYNLLDLICLYCDRDPVEEEGPDTETEDTESGDQKGMRGRGYQATGFRKFPWKENNNAERIFNLLPERDTRCYSALIRGMVMHRAFAKAFNMYTDMLNNRLTADVHIFNALISAAPTVRDQFSERWELITELLNQMNQQKIRPSLLTFNSVLRALRNCGSLAKTQCLHTLSEMRVLRIAPSLATYAHILAIFLRPGFSSNNSIEILREIVAEMAETSFTCQDPMDVQFFSTAMKICLENKDLELGYKVNSVVEFGENWRLLGDLGQQNVYYTRFFDLLCMMEHIDEVLKWYKRVVPSLYYPKPLGIIALLQALDADSRLDLLPSIWKEMKSLGHDDKTDLVEQVLSLMTRENHSAEVQESFATCALDIKNAFDVNANLEWSNASLSDVTTLLLRANKTQQAWELLKLFKNHNRVPSDDLLNAFLSVCHSDGAPQKAVELVQMSAAFCLLTTPQLAKRALTEFDLTEEQRAILSELEAAGELSG